VTTTVYVLVINDLDAEPEVHAFARLGPAIAKATAEQQARGWDCHRLDTAATKRRWQFSASNLLDGDNLHVVAVEVK
jgi:hypothetical protein